MAIKNYIFLIILLLSQITLIQAQNCNTPYNARTRGDFCITAQNVDVSAGYQAGAYKFKLDGISYYEPFQIEWYIIPYEHVYYSNTDPNVNHIDWSNTYMIINPSENSTICVVVKDRASGLVKIGYLDIDLNTPSTVESCGENDCETVGLINANFENEYWTNNKWIRKNNHSNGEVVEYSNFNDDGYISSCEAKARDIRDRLIALSDNQEYLDIVEELYQQNRKNCNQDYIPFCGDCVEKVRLSSIDFFTRLVEAEPSLSMPNLLLTTIIEESYINNLEICFIQDNIFPDGSLNEHWLIGKGFSFAPLNDDLVLPSEYLNNPYVINSQSLGLGFSGGLGLPNDPSIAYNVEASVEQTFFVEETEVARLDIWYAWVTNYYKEELIENEEERKNLFEAPVFSIELFRTDASGNDYLVESFVESQQDFSSTHLYTIDNNTYHDVFKDWGYNDGSERKPFTLDLSPYKGELVKLKITSYDRFMKDEQTGNVTKRLESYAVVDIACASCCVPAKDFAEVNPYSISDGVVTINRPQLPCELLPEPEDRCDPTFFYQITSDKGEPYVLEGKGTSIEFIPQYAGEYTVYYKHSESCCWNETPLIIPVPNVTTRPQPEFSNELKLSGVHCIPSFYMDSVLAVGASSFIDRQFVNTQEIAQSADKTVIENYLLTQNPYLTGERGIWRTEGSYAYVTERRGTKTVKEDNEQEIQDNGNLARTGGVFDLNMFNWQKRGVVPENWRKTGETSRYNPYNYGVESRDVLGRYSAALYGYNGQLSTAVCANAAYTEIAYDGFEDESKTSNFKIENPAPNTIDRSITLQVLWAKGERGVVEGYVPPVGSAITLDASLIAYVIGKQDIIEIKPNISSGQSQEKIEVELTYRNETTSWFKILPKQGETIDARLFTEQWYGSIAIARDLSVISGLPTSTASVYPEVPNRSSNEGHTGVKSLEVKGNTEILQSNLLLKPTKKYVVSAWVKVAGAANQIYTYADMDKVGIQLAFYRKDGSPISAPNSPVIVPMGNIIEGWQRLEGVIEVPDGAFYTTTKLQAQASTVYYDDIRIFPADGSMKTFVYDPINYLLRAVLDENNYASLYFYDDAERLFLTQKETREGIYTIQENGGFINHRLPPPDNE